MANDKNISQIETNGVNPVPDSERYGKPADLFPIWFSWNISIFGITCGMYVFGLGLSVAQAMAAAFWVTSSLARWWAFWQWAVSARVFRHWCSLA